MGRCIHVDVSIHHEDRSERTRGCYVGRKEEGGAGKACRQPVRSKSHDPSMATFGDVKR